MTPFVCEGKTAHMEVDHIAETAGLEPWQVCSSDACPSDLPLPAGPHLLQALQPWCKLQAEHPYHGLESGEDPGNPNCAEVES